jgi:hypothetical protein
MLTLKIEHDEHAEDPLNDSGWKLHTFDRPGSREEVFQSVDEYGDVNWQIGYKRKAQYGLAHILSCYRHSGTSWSIKGEGTQCRWDTQKIAGALIWQDPAADCGKGEEARTKRARAELEQFNAYCNGGVYFYSILDEEGDTLDSCGGFYSTGDELAKQIVGYLPAEYIAQGFKIEAPEYVMDKADLTKALNKETANA